MFRSYICVVALLWTALVQAQQAPFVPVTGPNAPKGPSALYQDSRGGLWLAPAQRLDGGLRYFDGKLFLSTTEAAVPHMVVSGMAEVRSPCKRRN